MQVKTHVKASGIQMNHNATLMLDRAPRAQRSARYAIRVSAGVRSHLRNALGLALVGGGVIGIMYLMLGSFIR